MPALTVPHFHVRNRNLATVYPLIHLRVRIEKVEPAYFAQAADIQT